MPEVKPVKIERIDNGYDVVFEDHVVVINDSQATSQAEAEKLAIKIYNKL